MNRLIRTVCMMIIFFPLQPALVRPQDGIADPKDGAAHASPQIDTTRSKPPVRIPGSETAPRPDSLAKRLSDTAGTGGAKPARSAIPVKSDTMVLRITPFQSVGSLSPSSDMYTSIDAAGILWKDYRTLTDVISALPGVFVMEKGSPGQEHPVSFAGAGPAATGFLVDGIAHNDPFTGTYNFSLFPVESIDRLEVVTGTRAFLYSDRSAGGAVNVVTKSFSNNKPYTRIRYSQAADSYVQTDAMFSQNIFSRFNLMFGLSYQGYGLDNAANFYRGRYANAASQEYTFRTKLRYNISSAVNLVFTHFFHQAETNLNGGIDMTRTAPADWYNEGNATVINFDAYEKRFNHHAALTAIYRPTSDSTLSASVTLFGSHLLREYRDEENRPRPNGIFVHEDFETAVFGARAQADWVWRGNAFTASAESKQTRFERSLFGPASTEARRHISIKDELSPFRFVTLAGFLKIENGQDRILENFGADATIRLSDLVSVTAGASQAHRRPAPSERYLASGAADTTVEKILLGSRLIPWQASHLPLADEIHHVSEIGIRVTPHAHLAFGLAASRRMIDGWIDNSLIVPHQGQNVTFDILTATVETHLGRIFADASVEYTHQSALDRGDRFAITTQEVRPYPNSYSVLLYPEWRGQCSVYFRGPLAKGNLDLKAGVNARFVSAYDGMQDRFPDGVPNPTFKQTIGGAGVLNLFILAHLGDAQIHIIWENVTNTGYMLAPFYPMYDSGFRFGLSWEFWD